MARLGKRERLLRREKKRWQALCRAKADAAQDTTLKTVEITCKIGQRRFQVRRKCAVPIRNRIGSSNNKIHPVGKPSRLRNWQQECVNNYGKLEHS